MAYKLVPNSGGIISQYLSLLAIHRLVERKHCCFIQMSLKIEPLRQAQSGIDSEVVLKQQE